MNFDFEGGNLLHNKKTFERLLNTLQNEDHRLTIKPISSLVATISAEIFVDDSVILEVGAISVNLDNATLAVTITAKQKDLLHNTIATKTYPAGKLTDKKALAEIAGWIGEKKNRTTNNSFFW